MTLPRQHSSSARNLPAVTAPRREPQPSRKQLEREVQSKMRQLEEQVRSTNERIQAGEMDFDDLAE